jgi:hypothetical protein
VARTRERNQEKVAFEIGLIAKSAISCSAYGLNLSEEQEKEVRAMNKFNKFEIRMMW